MALPRRFLVVLLPGLALSAIPAPGVSALDGPCQGYAVIEFQGPSCPLEDGWLLLFPDGSSAMTHGPDPAPAGGREAFQPLPDIVPFPPACVQDPTEPHHRLVYAYPPGRNVESKNSTFHLRTLFAQANGFLRDEAAHHGRSLSYLTPCDSNGQAQVISFALSTPASQTSFWSIVNELRAANHTDPNAKYIVLYDGSVGNFCGQATIRNDDRPGADNGNNKGNDYGISYGGCAGFRTLLHENLHNMGAVQRSAPHTTGAYHCNDGLDIMCYEDGGSDSRYDATICADDTRIDCNNDDYFHPNPAPGSYLATHWNVASTANRFLHHTPDCDVILEGSPLHASAFPGGSATISVPKSCRGTPYTLEGDTVDTFLKADFNVCWHGSRGVLRCDERIGDEWGTIPGGTSHAVLHHAGWVPGSYRLILG